MDTLLQDIRLALRSLRRTPAFTATVRVVMALGIGVNALIFSVVRGILLRDVPFPQPERLVAIKSVSQGSVGETETSIPDFVDVRERAKSFEHVAATVGTQVYVTLGSEPERFDGVLSSSDLPALLRTKPLLGRWFTQDEEIEGHQFATVVLGYRPWRERLKGDPDVIGHTLRMNGRVRTIVGVMPEGFRFPENSDFFLPLASRGSDDSRGGRYLKVIGRLGPGASAASATAELRTLSLQLGHDYPETNAKMRLMARGYHDDLVTDVQPMIVTLALAVAFVLLIACANVANLLLARMTNRHREVAVRMALGGSRTRIVGQMMVETLVLTIAGAAGGMFIANAGLKLVLANIPQEFPYWMHFEIDGAVFAFAALAAVVTGLLAGIAPALHSTTVQVLPALQDGSAGAGDSRKRNRMRHTLVVAEVALAVVLLICSGLMVRSFLRMSEQATRVRTDGVLTGGVTLPYAVYPKDEQKRAFFAEFRSALQQMPGVHSVGAVSTLHLGSGSWTRTIFPESRDAGTSASMPNVSYNVITPGYLETMGIPVQRGRDFTDADGAATPRVAIVNESAARLLWPGADVLGKRFNWGKSDTLGWITVVGVVADVRQNAKGYGEPAEVLVPHPQEPVQSLTWAIRSSRDPAELTPAVRSLLRARDRDMPFYEALTMRRHVERAIWDQRIFAWLMAVFSALALVIAAVGLYGVMAYAVAQRTREIGIRMALGAARGDVQRLVVGQAVRLTVLGMGIGLALAFALARLMESQLFQVRPDDPPTYAVVTLILASSAVLAAWAPTVRATRVDPMVALRHD